MSNIFKITPQKKCGKIKPLHAVGAGPRQVGAKLSFDSSEIFKEIGIPYSRLHDIEGAYGANQFVDIHCVFPDFDADENDPASYNFYHTDQYINAIYEVGTKVYYRLGETIDWYHTKLHINPPKDFLKWAKICEHIIRHYNEGWADGYYLDIKYWEIWNEPDNKRMWTGTYEEFYELYCVASTHLKKCFPHLKIGGVGASGFYAFNREDSTDWFKSIIPFHEGFFEYITQKEEKIPLDFFAWHCYAESPEEVKIHAEFARNLLEKYGYSDAESILDEYNTFESLEKCPAVIPDYASTLGATMIVAQNSPLDMLFYYDLRLISMNGVFQRDFDFASVKRLQGFYSLRAFGNLYRMGDRCECIGDINKVYILSATSEGKVGVMICATDFEGEIVLSLPAGAYSEYNYRESTYEVFDKETKGKIKEDGTISLLLKRNSVYEIVIK